MKKNIFIFAFLTTIIFIFSGLFLNTFFQQDEWNGFGIVLVLSQQPWWSWFQVLAGQHVVPFTALFWYILFKSFGYNAQYYALISLTLHSIASFLVFLLAKKITKNGAVALLCGILFAVSYQSNEAYLHLAVFGNTVTVFICFLLFLLYSYDLPKKIRMRDLAILVVLYFSTVFFREDGLILIPLLPIYLYLFNKKALSKKNLWAFILFYSFSLGFLVFRFLSQIFNPAALKIDSRSYFFLYIYNALTVPFKIFVQEVIDPNSLLNILLQYGDKIYPQKFTFNVYITVFLDFAYFTIALAMSVLIVLVCKYYKNPILNKIVVFSFSLILFNGLLLSAVGRRLDIIESRYLYLSSFSFAILLSMILYIFFTSTYKSKLLEIIIKACVTIFVTYLVITSFTTTRKELHTLVFQSNIRKSLVNDLFKISPMVNKRIVFYMQCKNKCSSNSLFGIDNRYVLPFSFGPGYILLVNYAKNDPKIYTKFLVKTGSKEFLWDYGSQGYKEINGYGFGYFYDKKQLIAAIKKYKLKKDNIIGLLYNESNFTISDDSITLRNQLFGNQNEKSL